VGFLTYSDIGLSIKYRFKITISVVGSVNIETVEDLKKALKETGYSDKAIAEIIKWYNTNRLPMN